MVDEVIKETLAMTTPSVMKLLPIIIQETLSIIIGETLAMTTPSVIKLLPIIIQETLSIIIVTEETLSMTRDIK